MLEPVEAPFDATMKWVDWYNNRRLHSALGMRTSVEYEMLYANTTAARESP